MEMVWELICWVFLMFFMLLGLAVSIYFVLFHAITPAKPAKYLLLIPSPDSGSDAASQIYAAQLQAELLGRRQCGGVLVLGDALNEETAHECALACRACGKTRLCTMAEIGQLLESHTALPED